MEGTELGGDQQFCLRWNNFQANITSQFEALRDDEDFVDVTLACEGHRLEAHKVVLSACSPYFKELFKNNPCPHPIIFMRDCEVSHVRALLQFMYVGQVNIAQAQLSAFLRTADALQIRGLTDCSQHNDKKVNRKSPPSQLRNLLSAKPSHSTSSSKAASQNVESTCADDLEKGANRRSEINSPDAARNNLNEEASFQTSSQTRPNNDDLNQTSNYPTLRVKTDLEATEINNEENDIPMDPGDSEEADKCQDFTATDLLEPKMEVMEQEVSDEERSNFQSYFNENNALANPNPFATLQGNIDLMAGMNSELRDENAEVGGGAGGAGASGGPGVRCSQCGRRYSNASNLRQHVRLIHEAQPVVCSTCGRCFKTPLYLRRHTLAQHPAHPARLKPPPPPLPALRPAHH
ncbi:protein tramtrack, beta isoform-like isoform X3 [Danaus plexippus]|uniref:protein tramtrack, beta isoform-like isoform X3 n=1 Tax=Danaus plexippus TaxID=13037 RepID=UPI002AB2A291|nr:protein tramtrack, beta isoform-like isoform X3 [Danaus plexippus]